MKITAVKDMKADIFLQPQFNRTLPDALRSWEVISNESESLVSRFPEDFYLYHLANFDPNTGRIEVLDNPSSLGSARDFKKKPAQELPFPQKSASN